MSLLTKFFPKKQQEDLPIGIAEDETHYCIAYLVQEQPIVNFYPKSTALTEILATISGFSGKKKQIILPCTISLYLAEISDSTYKCR